MKVKMATNANHLKDRPWLMRTYSGYASAKESNLLYRANLAKGQTGLSIAFDLPTQMAYDSDDILAKGEVGKLGVPVRTIEDMETLFDHIPIEKMNTSMTINAPAAWLLALYIATAQRQGADISRLRGTTQNDILKEYLSRGTYIFPPKASIRLISELIIYTVNRIPQWNPINICSYHLQEAGATPVQELAFTLANAICILDTVKESGHVTKEDFPNVVGRISFFVNAGIRFVEELCKMRVFTRMWDRISKERYGVEDPKLRRFRYGVQVNSLGLTAQQPENNIARIIYEFLGVILSKYGRARSVQLPAWNEALGLPRKWDQQWSLRLQQIMAFETDLLEYEDIFMGSKVITKKEKELEEATEAEMDKIQEMGGVIPALESGYMKQQLVESSAERIRLIESGEKVVVGVNKFMEAEPSPLTSGGADRAVQKVNDSVEAEQIEILESFRRRRNNDKVAFVLDHLKESINAGKNIMEVSIECAREGVTIGEWGCAMREIFGEYRAPTGISMIASNKPRTTEAQSVNEKVKRLSKMLGRNLKILVAKPGLDGHSNGAEQIAVKARDVGMDVVYEGIRLTPVQIAESAMQEGVHVVGLSILSGSHLDLIPEVMKGMEARGIGDIPIVLGGIIPQNDMQKLYDLGIKKIYTPKDFDLNEIMIGIVGVVAKANDIDL
jgi:(2R)-ethylmalonyl-CoA mutase